MAGPKALLLLGMGVILHGFDPCSGTELTDPRATNHTGTAPVLFLSQGDAEPAAKLLSAYAPYSFKLSPFRSPWGGSGGLRIQARINDSKPLWFLIDTGAHGVFVNSAAVQGTGVRTISSSEIGGLPRRSSRAHVAISDNVSFGPLRFGNVFLQLSEKPLTSGADGVLGLDLFASFEIHIDADAKKLELLPSQTGAYQDVTEMR